MALDNYRDLSTSGNDVSAGFQFEFNCTKCSYRWKSPFQPYRLGQITGFLTRFAFIFTPMRNASRATGNFADIGSRGAREKALEEAKQKAQTLFTNCPSCKDAACGDCFSVRDGECRPCLEKASEQASQQQDLANGRQREAKAHACPNCGTASDGGRFCPECGFDMASTHKSCPGCGAMASRQARFCTDCGHGY